MKNFTVTLEINSLVDVQVKADSLEDALKEARKLRPSAAIKPRTKKNSVIDWEVRSISSVYEG